MTDREQQICELFAEVLGVTQVESNDSFFDLGGHSLLVAQLTSRLKATFGVRVPMRRVYAAPTAETLDKELTRIQKES